MALTYDQSADLMKDPDFFGRVKVGCLTYARYITDEPATTPAHSTRIKWAQQALLVPDSAASQVIPTCVMDTAVQDAGVDAEGHSLITDAALQGAVETSINKLL
jgi:hypothetical protein